MEKRECYIVNVLQDGQVDNTIGNIIYTEENSIIKPESNAATLKDAKMHMQWTNNATNKLLDLYEANMGNFGNPKKKTKLWDVISQSLRDDDIFVSSDQVRWKINSLTKKYKECVDHNRKFGGDPVTFEFFNQMENIYHLSPITEDPLSTSMFSTLPDEFDHNNDVGDDDDDDDHDHDNNNVNLLTNNQNNQLKSIINKQYKRKNTTIEDTKTDLEKKLLDFLNIEDKRRKIQDDKLIKLKKLKLDLKEKEIKINQNIQMIRQRFREKRHKELIEIEKIKCDLIKKLLDKSDI